MQTPDHYIKTIWDKMWGRAIVGFLSVYIIWLIPSWIFHWTDLSPLGPINLAEDSLYIFGDHIILPLFNAVAFTLLPNKPKIGLKYIPLFLMFLTAIAILLGSFDVDTQILLRQEVDKGIDVLHVVFTFIEVSFIVFMCAVFPFWQNENNAPKLARVTLLYILVACFIVVIFVTGNFETWKLLGLSFIVISWLAVLFHYKRSRKKLRS